MRIVDLEIETIIGVYPQERQTKQRLIVSIELEIDMTIAIQSDRLEDTVDYDALSQDIRQYVRKSRYHLIESLGQCILDRIMSNKQIRSTRIRLVKPKALDIAGTVELELNSDAWS